MEHWSVEDMLAFGKLLTSVQPEWSGLKETKPMFKSMEQVITFTDHLERFIKAAIVSAGSPAVEDALYMNRTRESFENHIMAISGIAPASDTTDTYLCPDCGGEMIERKNRSNGDKFYGCKKYPECRGTRDENGLSKADKEEIKYRRENPLQQEGFSFNKKRDIIAETSPPQAEPSTAPKWVNPFKK